MAKSKGKNGGKGSTTANIGFETKLWLAADKLRNNMDAAEYKHVVLGLIFLKYISDAFEEHRAKLVAGQGDYEGADPEERDEYVAASVFWVPKEARWPRLQSGAKLPSIGKDVDDAMVALERDNPRLKGALNKNYGRADLDKHRLGELIDLIGSIELADAAASVDTLRTRWTAGTSAASPGSLPVAIAEAATDAAEAEGVAARVGEWLAESGVSPGDVAVLYLRNILAMDDSAERQLALVEIVSVLSLATAHRAAHRDVPAAAARVGFAERLRARLGRTLPVPLSARPRTDAVHVMTCHASKGLEFPCVAVVGQTLHAIADRLDWLPPAIRPETSRGDSQADALLFVGVTRATRAVLVSFPRRAVAGTRARGKAVVPLLQRWREGFGVPTVQWGGGAIPDIQSPNVRAGNIWDVPLPKAVKAQALGDSVCPLLSYLEMYVQARFPEASRALYPSFVGFARAFRPMAAQGVTRLDTELVLPSADGLDVRLDLIAHYRQSDGTVVAIAFRPESLAPDQRSLNWSDLGEAKRASLALLEHGCPGATPYLYSGADERIYEYRWSRDKRSLPALAARLEERRGALARGDLSTEVARYQCDRCRARVSCPRWIGALNGG